MVQGTSRARGTRPCAIIRRVSPRPRLTDTRRRDILDATVTAIAERGLCETRIADVAERIGASPALVLYYFPSKAALLTEALIHQDQLFYENVREELESAETAEDKLIVLIEASCPQPRGSNDDIDGWLIWPATWETVGNDAGQGGGPCCVPWESGPLSLFKFWFFWRHSGVWRFRPRGGL